MNRFLFIILLISSPINSFAQKNDSIDLSGRWKVCISLDKNYECEVGYVTYEFFRDGTFKDPRGSVDGEKSFMTGKWKLQNNILIIDYDDGRNSTNPPRIFSKFL